ncbi:MAG: SdpI family protein [Flavobacteriaceae bacterium]|nr:SdpI family protein [Flavobacteriaceae bacterium]
MEAQDQLLMSLGYLVFMLIVSFIFVKFPPKKINYFYGYRTRHSMVNQEIWTVANNYSSKFMVKITLTSIVFPPILYFIYPEYNLLITIIVHTILLLSILYFTEKHLTESFGKDGKSK